MKEEILKIKNIIVSEIDPEKIIYLSLGPMNLFLIVWDSQMKGFDKRIYIRKLLRSIEITFDITVYTMSDLQKSIEEEEFLTLEIIRLGTILYDKENDN